MQKLMKSQMSIIKIEVGWLHKSIMNIAHSGFFTSDRTIANYNSDIWHLEKNQFR